MAAICQLLKNGRTGLLLRETLTLIYDEVVLKYSSWEGGGEYPSMAPVSSA